MMEGGSRLLLGGEKSCGGALRSPLSARRLYLRNNKLSKLAGLRLSLLVPKMSLAVLKTLSEAADPGGAQ